MIGTLTIPCLDFGLIRTFLGISDGIDILDEISSRDEETQKIAHALIAELELVAAARLALQPKCAEMLGALSEQGLKLALITRNTRKSVGFFLEKLRMHTPFRTSDRAKVSPHFPFDFIVTREAPVYKPDPAVLSQELLPKMALQPSELLIVGDSLGDDVQCGYRARCRTCLFAPYGKNHPSPSSATIPPDVVDLQPDFTVGDLMELVDITRQLTQKAPPRQSFVCIQSATTMAFPVAVHEE